MGARSMSWKPLPAAAVHYGVDPSAIISRIRSRAWLEGQSWIVAPDGDILVNVANRLASRDRRTPETSKRGRIWVDPPVYASLTVSELRKPGIYFLSAKGCVVYIGQSKCLMHRIGTHLLEGLKDFDSVAWITCGLHELNALERAHITIYRPKLNSKVPT